METLTAIWTFMKEGVVISAIVAVVLPWVGAILAARRTSVLGVAVPQFSAAGIALGLALLPWFPSFQEEFLNHGHPPLEYLFVFAASAAALALLVFGAVAGRQGKALADSQVAAGFAAASAFALIALEWAPAGNSLVETLQRGSVVVADIHSLWVVLIVDGLALLALGLFTTGILLVSFDRDMATVLGHRPGFYEFIWNIIVGASIGVGVMTIGPVLVFGLLFIPPLAARQFATSMRSYLSLSVVMAILPIAVSWPVSFSLDLPYGPTATMSLAIWALGLALLAQGRKRFGKR